MKRVIPIVLLLALVAAGVYLYPRWFPEKKANGRLTLSGNIEAHESVLSFKVAGRIVELPVEEGQWVEEGAVIARLDDKDYRQQVALDESSVRVRESNLKLALAGTRKQEIEAAQATLSDAEADLAQKKIDFERAKTLYAKDVIPAESRDLAATALKRAQAGRDRAQELYAKALEGTRAEELDVARVAVTQAQEAAALSRVKLGYTVLRAPKAGVISVRQAELGEVVAPGTPVVTLADLKHVWLRAYVAETDLARIRFGQSVEVHTDTFAGKTYPGTIAFISPKAEFTPKTVETHKERVTLVYRIKIDVENPNQELKPGMPADAVIEEGGAK